MQYLNITCLYVYYYTFQANCAAIVQYSTDPHKDSMT